MIRIKFSQVIYLIIGLGLGYIINYWQSHSVPQTQQISSSIKSHCEDQNLVNSGINRNATETHPQSLFRPETCSCDDIISCDSIKGTEKRTAIDEIFSNLLASQEYSEAIDLYSAIFRSSSKEAKQLKQILLKYLADSLARSFETNTQFEDLSNTYLSDFHNDIDILLMLAKYQGKIGRFYEGINTLQLTQSYVINDSDQGKYNHSYREYMDQAAQALKDEFAGLELSGFYEFVNTAGLLKHEDRFELVKLYLDQGNYDFAKQTAYVLMQDGLWKSKIEQLLSRSETASALPESRSKQAFESSIELIPRGSHYLVPVSLSGSESQLLLDTGASITTVTKAFYDQMEHRLNFDYERSAIFNTANGAVRAEVYRLDNFKIGQYTISDLEVTVLDYPSPDDTHGLLGMNVLRYFEFQINQKKARLELTPHR